VMQLVLVDNNSRYQYYTALFSPSYPFGHILHT
jgi:hypothetical protein